MLCRQAVNFICCWICQVDYALDIMVQNALEMFRFASVYAEWVVRGMAQ